MTAHLGGNLDYACARVAAREGMRPDAIAWGRIATARDLGSMLDVARSSPVRAWTAGITVDGEPHAIEQALRGHWRALVREVTHWMPARWQAAVSWFGLVPALPLLEAVRRGEPVPWLPDTGSDRAFVATALRSLQSPAAAGMSDAWRNELRRRLPESHAREAPRLGEWLRLLVRHEAAMAAAPPGDATLIVQALRERLRTLLRRSTLEPTAVFVFLTHSALDLARFRGEIMRRRLFPRLGPSS